MKRTVNVNSSILKFVLISIFSSVLLFFILNNFGNFGVFYYGGKQPHKTFVENIYYTTPLGTKVETGGNGYTYTDVLMKGEVFQKNYFVKLPYVIKSVLKDIPYIIILSSIIFMVLFFQNRFNLRLSSNTESGNPSTNKNDLKSNNSMEVDKSILSLKELNKAGIITDSELKNKISKLEREKEHNYKQSRDYLHLKELFEKGYLTLEEFEKKGQIVKDKIQEDKY